MNRQIHQTKTTLCVMAAVLLSIVESGTGAPALTDHAPLVDWPAFLSRHDMTFQKPPRNWTEAPHFGNAMLGSMLYQDGDNLKLQIFRADAHDQSDPGGKFLSFPPAR